MTEQQAASCRSPRRSRHRSPRAVRTLLYGVGLKLLQLLQNLCENSQSAVRVGKELGEWFETTVAHDNDINFLA